MPQRRSATTTVRGRPSLLDLERVIAFGAVTVAGDHAPVHAIFARGQRRNTHRQQTIVLGTHAAIAAIDPFLVLVLDADRAEHRLDLAVEPDAHFGRRGIHAGSDSGIGV